MEKRVHYTHSNSYSTLNDPSATDRSIWMVFHGMGHLSRYFIRHFQGLDPKQHYIIAPQAPSKYYQGSEYKHVGACWLTRDDTVNETENVLSYVETVWEIESIRPYNKKIVLGYSQGVSIAMRWLARYRHTCDMLILHSGGLPKELTPEQFDHLGEDTSVQLWYGKEDPYLNSKRVDEETDRAKKLFGQRLQLVPFDGGHQVNEGLIVAMD